MRIAYVCMDAGIPVFGCKGGSVHVQEIVRAFRQRGCAVELFAARFGGAPPADLATVPAHCLAAPPAGDRPARERSALEANPTLMAALRRAGPFDLVYERYALWSSAGMEYARDTGIPGVLEVNAPLIEEQARHRGLVDGAGALAVAHRVLGAARVIVAVSRPVASYLDAFPGARGRIHVVPNGVDPSRFAVNAPAARDRDRAFTVGFVGTLKPWHGVDTLVAAFGWLHRRDPDSRLLVVGAGPGYHELRQQLEREGLLEAAHLTGALAPFEVPARLASMDVGVAPYPRVPDCYFSPLKIYEYMAAGLPVVATRIGQAIDVIRHGENGLLCEPGDPADLATALDWLRRHPAERRRLGGAARAAVLRRHTWAKTVQHILRLAGFDADAAPRVPAATHP